MTEREGLLAAAVYVLVAAFEKAETVKLEHEINALLAAKTRGVVFMVADR